MKMSFKDFMSMPSDIRVEDWQEIIREKNLAKKEMKKQSDMIQFSEDKLSVLDENLESDKARIIDTKQRLEYAKIKMYKAQKKYYELIEKVYSEYGVRLE